MNAETPTIPSVAPIEVSVEQGKTYWWCACGRSKTQPFCDGSHKGTSFTPLKYRAGETESKRFCVCKQTASPPFCDGHNHGCSEIVRTATSV